MIVELVRKIIVAALILCSLYLFYQTLSGYSYVGWSIERAIWLPLGVLLGIWAFFLAKPTHKDCPKCGERIRLKASYCNICKHDI